MNLVHLPAPPEGDGVSIALIKPALNVLSKLVLRIHAEAAQAHSRHLTEERFNQIERASLAMCEWSDYLTP